LKVKSRPIADLKDENNRLVAEKWAMDGEFIELRPLR